MAKHSSAVDIEAVRRSFTKLFAIPDLPFLNSMINAIVFLSRALEMDLHTRNSLSLRDNFINIFLIVMEIPALGSPEFIESATPQFCKALGLLSDTHQARLARIWSTFGKDRLISMVGCIQQMITVRIVCEYQMDETASLPKPIHEDDAIIGIGL